MKEVKIYLSDKLIQLKNFQHDWDNSPVFKTLKVEDDCDLWNSPIKVKDEFYNVCMSQGDNYCIDKLDFYNYEDDIQNMVEYNEDNILCPVCGYEETDCWEYSNNEEDEHECQGCGSILSWEREYTVTYKTKVVNRSNFIEA